MGRNGSFLKRVASRLDACRRPLNRQTRQMIEFIVLAEYNKEIQKGL
jgi:hypothetical protein